MPEIEIIALPQFEKELKQLAKKYPSIPQDFEILLNSFALYKCKLKI